MLNRCKYSSLFYLDIFDEEKKFYDIGTGAIGSLVFEEEYKNEVFNFFFN
jgi:hypothetical protein